MSIGTNADLNIPMNTANIDNKTQHNAIGDTLLTNLTPINTNTVKTSNHIVPYILTFQKKFDDSAISPTNETRF